MCDGLLVVAVMVVLEFINGPRPGNLWAVEKKLTMRVAGRAKLDEDSGAKTEPKIRRVRFAGVVQW